MPTKRLYDFIDGLDSSGTLVLPFAGVNFSAFQRLPSRITKLVVYNSKIGTDFASLVSKLKNLHTLVLWGCFHDELLARSELEAKYLPSYSMDSFGDSFSRVRELISIHCSDSLNDHLGWHHWPTLERLNTTRLFGKVKAHDILEKGALARLQTKMPMASLPKPSYPKLSEVLYWRGDKKSLDKEEVHRMLIDTFGREITKVSVN